MRAPIAFLIILRTRKLSNTTPSLPFVKRRNNHALCLGELKREMQSHGELNPDPQIENLAYSPLYYGTTNMSITRTCTHLLLKLDKHSVSCLDVVVKWHALRDSNPHLTALETAVLPLHQGHTLTLHYGRGSVNMLMSGAKTSCFPLVLGVVDGPPPIHQPTGH